MYCDRLALSALFIGTVVPPLLALFAAAGLADCLSDRPGPRGALLRGLAALCGAALVTLCAVLLSAGTVGLSDGPGEALALVATLLALLFSPCAARFALWKSAKSGGRLHRVAAWPIWSVAVCLSGVLAVGGQSVTGFLFLLAPTLLFGVAAYDAVRGLAKPASRTNAEVLAFLTPSAGAGTCTVCAERVHHRRVACPRCAAPHHRECWEFNGQCGGCANQRLS